MELLHQHQIFQLKLIRVRDILIKHSASFLLDFLGEPRTLSSSINGIYSHQSPSKTHKASNNHSDVLESTSNPTSESEHISDVNSGSQNAYTRTSSSGSSTPVSRSRSPVSIRRFNSFDIKNGHDYLIDSDKGNSLLSGTSFDVLMNSLKSMREKDLDYLIHSSDDSLIRVVD
jgi:hypothetical protein